MSWSEGFDRVASCDEVSEILVRGVSVMICESESCTGWKRGELHQ